MVNKTSSAVAGAPAAARRLSPADRRAHLLRACLDLIGSRPWDEVSMAEVAEHAAVSKPLLYHYFSTKTELYRAAVRAAAAELRAATTLSNDIPPAVRLERSLEAHVRWIDANASAYRAVLQGGVSADDEVQAIIEESRADVLSRLADGLGLEEPTPAQRIVLRGWVGFLEGATLDWLTSKQLTDTELVGILAAALIRLASGSPAIEPAGTR